MGLVGVMVLSGCSVFSPKKEPQKAVEEGFSKLVEVKKTNSKMTLNGVLNAPPGETPKQVKFSVDASGISDSSDEKSPKIDMKMKLNVSLDDQGGSGEIFVKAVDKKLYLNVSNLTIAGEAGKGIQTRLTSFLNTWWALPLDEGKNPFTALTGEQKKMQELFKNTKFFINAKEAGSESVEGIATTRYNVDLDKEALKKFIVEVAKLGGNILPPNEESAITAALNEIEFSGSVWVGNNDDVIHRIKGTVTLQAKQGPTGSFEFDQTSYEHGKDFTVTAPAGAQEFNPLLIMGLMGGLPDTPSLPETLPLPGTKVK